jgi:DNA-binding transcriptional MocR family regulator
VIERAVGPRTLSGLLGDWRVDGPAYRQLAGEIRRLVADGRLPMQSRLPAERHLAVELGVSRNTVTAAYERLRGEGYLASRQGSGTWTTLPDQPTVPGIAPGGMLDLTVAAPAAPPGLAAYVARGAARLGSWAAGHGYEPLGLPALRTAIANHLSEGGLPTTQAQVLVTNGAMHAIHLVLGALARRGDVAAVELPTYPSVLDALRTTGIRTTAIPVTAAGWDIDLLRSTFRRTRPQFAYVIPDFQNPTGALVDADQRRELLKEALTVGSHVLVDQTFVEMSLTSVAMPSMVAALDDDPRILTIGSMSKAYWGGLRIGWVRATPTLVQRLARVRAEEDMASPVMEQLIAAELLADPAPVLRSQRWRATFQRDALTAALRTHLPEWRWTEPAGGWSVWAELPEPTSGRLATLAQAEGVRIAPGSRFGSPGVLDRYVRLPYSLPPADLLDAVKRIASAYGSQQSAAGSRSGPAYVA